MYFAEFNAVLAQARDSVGRILKFDGKVTRIVVDAEMLAKARVAGSVGRHLFEEGYRFRCGFKITQRFGLQAEVKLSPGSPREFSNVVHATPQIRPHCRRLIVGPNEFFKGAWDRADASLDTFGNKLRQDIEKAIHELQLVLELRYPMAANENSAGGVRENSQTMPYCGCTIVCGGECGDKLCRNLNHPIL